MENSQDTAGNVEARAAQPHDGHAHNGEPGQEHDHEHDHTHHDERHGLTGLLAEVLPFGHGHSHGEMNVDSALESSERGISALRLSLAILGATAVLQLVVAVVSGSVGLLADTIHNFADALTAIPLWVAFSLSKRAPTRRYTYGYGRAEDVAGVIIVAVIGTSALIAAYEAIQKLLHPVAMTNLGWVAAAAIVGFLGNEAVATVRIRAGNEIGSAALVADGKHARADGLTSLAVLVGVIGDALGFPLADPLVGLLITLAIVVILRDTAVTMWHRLMDAVDPEIVDQVERVAAGTPGVESAGHVRMRWMGHRLEAELHIDVDEELSTRQSHDIVEEVRHRLFHDIPKMSVIHVHVDPCGHSGGDPHALTAHHS